jgi:hypothetical protein
VSMKPSILHLGQGNQLTHRFRTGVSLHSHTLHSKESLVFIEHASKRSALLRAVLREGRERYRKIHGKELDLNRGWWTPTLAPMDAFRVESAQIENLGLTPLVSLSDHDDIEAGMSLQAMDATREVPISVEWTVPFGTTFFHIGVHNILPQHARLVMQHLEEFTARPETDRLCTLFSDLDAFPSTLIIFNHPLWDEKGIGADLHRQTVESFLARFSPFIHAFELNGLRPWHENDQAIKLAAHWRKPVISGGDRHTLEPNAILNVSNAANFAEFVEEVRVDGHSDVLVMPHYHEGHASRIFHNMLDVFRTYEGHGRGWKEWGDRVFFTAEHGEVRSLKDYWGEKPPPSIALFAGFMQFVGQLPRRASFRNAETAQDLNRL